MLKRKMNSVLAVLMLAAFVLACGLGDQTTEANKLIDEANALITQNNERITKSNTMFTDLMGNNLSEADDLEKYKTINKAKFDELLSVSEQIEKSSAEIIGKFEAASKLKVDEKYKQYLDGKVLELKKRNESEKMTIPFVKTFLETKDAAKVNQQIEDFNKKSAELSKEAEELMKKADQIAKDNPGKIK